jgi:hypothetical protein
MIKEDRVEAAVEYLRDTAKQYGQARGRAMYAENNLRRVKALNMPGSGTVAEREAAAYASDDYLKALEELENAVADSETIRALREAASYTIEVWRSQNSARKQGVSL